MLRIFSLLFILISCAKTTDQKIDSAKQEAKYHLTHGSCAKAKSVLDDVNFQDDDADYVGLYAATYACKAGYTELGTVFPNLANMNASSLLSSTASFDSSDETEADSDDFLNLMRAINVILGVSSTTVKRFAKYGNAKATDLSLQTLYMILVTMGKFYAYYGNADENGHKGAGAAANVCLVKYDFHTSVDDWLTASPLNGCNSGNDGHADIISPVDSDTIKSRLCYGVVLFNNLLEILSNISLSDNESLGSLSEVSDVMTAFFTTAMAAEETPPGAPPEDFTGTNSIRTLKDITLQSDCEEQSLDDLKRYYLYIIETNFANS